MCTGLEILAAGALGLGAVSAKQGYDARSDAKKAAKNAAADTRKAEIDAINKSNSQIQMQRRALKDNSLFTGADSIGAAPQTLGVGG
jgi:hypothetical protein